MRAPTVKLITVAFIATAAAGQNASIEVDPAKILHPIPRTIFGSFLEPIGNSIYGGLWAELLENPSFEENLWSARNLQRKLEAEPDLYQSSHMGLPVPWQPLDDAQGWRYEPRWNDAANSYRSLLIMALPGKETGVRQNVYLPVHRVSRYTGSIYAKPIAGAKELTVSLRGRNRANDIFGSATIHLTSAGWKRYNFSLEAPSGKLAPREPADFVIAVADDARVFVDQASLMPADNVDGMDPEMITLSREMKTSVVRFGGNFTSAYHWRDGIGPRDKRVSMLNQSWGMPEYNQFGTDEFLRYCELIGAVPQIALNLGTGTPEEAVGWVKYVNGKWGDHSGGLLWELGNELWGNFQIGYPTLQRVTDRTHVFSSAIRRADPRALLIATGQDPDHFVEWNASQLRLAPDGFNYLSTHFVVGDSDVLKPHPTLEFMAESSLALPVGLERRLREMKAQIDSDPKAKDRVKIAFTEWLFHGQEDRVPRFDNMGGAICTSGFLNTLLRTADFTAVSDMTGIIEFGGIWKKRGQVYAVPAYSAFRLYSNADIASLVDSRTTVETYDVHEGNKRIPDIEKVPYLDVTAAINGKGDKLTLFCVNRDLKRDIKARIRVNGFAAGSEAKVQQLSASSIYEKNDEVSPDAVHPRDVNVAAAGPDFEYSFPAASVSVMQLRRR
jgi:alpha-N-arabinofuranosidase